MSLAGVPGGGAPIAENRVFGPYQAHENQPLKKRAHQVNPVWGERLLFRVTLFVAMRELAYARRRLVRRVSRVAMAERQILLRSGGKVRALTLGWRGQSVVLALLFSIIGWSVYTTLAHLESDRQIAVKEREIGSLKLAFRSLRTDVDRSETRFTELARTLEAKHAYLVALLGPDAAGGQIEKTGDDARDRISAARQDLLAQLGKLETVMQGSALNEGRQARDRLATERRLQLSAGDRARMGRDRRQLIARIEKLEDRLAALNVSQRGVAARMAERTMDQVDTVKSLISSTGVNVDALLARLGLENSPGLGGPFIAAGPDAAATRAMPASLGSLDHNLDRLDDIRKLARVLPLSPPSDHFYVGSGFGKRRDPINNRWAMHYGVDLGGISRSPVLATAPGVVVSVGWNGNYGRLVEIDHGMGIRTRYGHLRRTTVSKGQRVDLRQKVGEMGSSGRSTGIHLHYEILVNGEPRDPMKFLQAGEYVFKGL